MISVKKLLRNTFIGTLILLLLFYFAYYCVYGSGNALSPLEMVKVLINPAYYLKTDVGLLNTVYPAKKSLSVLYHLDTSSVKPIDQQTAILYLLGKKKAEILEDKHQLIFITKDSEILIGAKVNIAKLDKKQYNELVQMGIVKEKVFKPLNKTNINKATNSILFEAAKSIQKDIIFCLIFWFILAFAINVVSLLFERYNTPEISSSLNSPFTVAGKDNK